MSSRLQSAFFRGFALASMALVLLPAACETAVSTTGTTSDATATNGSGFKPPCNDNHQDGYCNAHGAIPESCECLDCADTAYCKQGCTNDGTCNPGAGEDCTCEDCFGATIDDEDCPFSNGQGPVTAPASASASSGGGGMGATSSAQSTAASTTASSSASGTGGMGSTGTM